MKEQGGEHLTRKEKRAQARVARRHADQQEIFRQQRRRTLKYIGGAVLAAAGLGAASQTVPGKAVVETLTGADVRQRLREWRLPEGQLMTDISPEVADAAEYLSAPSLEAFFPVFKGPIRIEYTKENEPGLLSVSSKFDSPEDSPVKISSWGEDNKPLTTPTLKSLSFKVVISEKMKGTRAELAVLAKEVIQIKDIIEYCKIYKKLVEENGARFDIKYSDDTKYQRDLAVLSWGVVQMDIAARQKKYNWLKEFLDTGAHLRVGGIAYANWWFNYPKERGMFPPIFTGPGDRVVQFLSNEGLLVRNGNVMRWKNGRAPQANSDEFAELYSKYTGVPLR